MQLVKYFRKLRRMSFDELAVRCGGVLRQQQERLETYWGKTPWSPASSVQPTLQSLGARAVQFVAGTKRPQPVCQPLNAWQTHVVARAQDLLNHEIQIFGQTWKLVNSSERWHRDPRSGYVWPKTFYADVPVYELGPQTDVKYIWELNRHTCFVDLAQAYWLTEDTAFAEQLRTWWLDWIDANPLHLGVNWTSGLEVAQRAIAWTWSLAMTCEGAHWQESDAARIAQSLAEHACYLERHFSLFSSPYNHLIGEATGLLCIAFLLEDHPRAAHWQRLAGEILSEHGPKQFDTDGFCVEQATGYHFFTLSFLLQAWRLSQLLGQPIAGLEDLLHRSFQVGTHFQQANQLWPIVGDFDSARGLPIYPADPRDFSGLCAAAAQFLKGEQTQTDTASASAECFWLCGENVPLSPAGKADATAGMILPTAGYVVARRISNNSHDSLLFDCGPLAAGVHRDATPSVAHGHLDGLGVVLSKSGEALLVDAGMPTYAGDRQVVDHYRSPRAHNTFWLESTPAAQISGRLGWSHVAYQHQLAGWINDQLWFAQGTIELDSQARLERIILDRAGDGTWIIDTIRCTTPQVGSWNWLIPEAQQPQFNVNTDTGPACQLIVQLKSNQLRSWSTAPFTRPRLISAGEGDPSGWISSGYGETERGYALRWETPLLSEVLCATYIGSQTPAAQLQVGSLNLRCNLGSAAELTSKCETVLTPWMITLRDSVATWSYCTCETQGAEPGWVAVPGEGNRQLFARQENHG